MRVPCYTSTTVVQPFSSPFNSMPIVTTSSKGQVVIPAGLRKRIGVKPGDKVSVTLTTDGKLMIEPVPQDPVEAAHGSLRGDSSLTEALLAERKKEATREEGEGARFLRAPRVSRKRTRVRKR